MVMLLTDGELPLVQKMCMARHVNQMRPENLYTDKNKKSWYAHCQTPGCSKPVAISWGEVAKIMGMEGKSKELIYAAVMQKVNAAEKLAAAEAAKRVTGPQMQQDGTEIPEDPPDDDDAGDNVGEEDGMHDEDEVVPEVVMPPQKTQKEAKTFRTRPERPDQSARSVPSPQDGPPLGPETEVAELSPRDVLVSVIWEATGLSDVEKKGMIRWVRLRPDWDVARAKELFSNYGLTNPMSTKLTQIFRNELEVNGMEMDRQERLAGIVDGGGSTRLGRAGSYGGQNQFGPQGQGSPAQDPESAAIQAVIAAAGGIITPQVRASMEAIHAVYSGGSVGMTSQSAPIGNLRDEIKGMFQEFALGTEEKKRREEERAKEKEETNRRFEEMRSLILTATMKNASVPLANPQDSEHKLLLETVLTMLKDKAAPVAPAAPAAPTRDEKMVEKLMDIALDNLKPKGDPNQPIVQAISELKEHMGRLGGGIGGLPTDPEQLRGLIDYSKTMGDIKKTQMEFEDKTANRDMISNVLSTGLQSIGEAAAAMFMQNPGTPEQKPVTLDERPIDDGSVVQIKCPNPGCGTTMFAPANAPRIRCPKCNTEFDRETKIVEMPQPLAAPGPVVPEPAPVLHEEVSAPTEQPPIQKEAVPQENSVPPEIPLPIEPQSHPNPHPPDSGKDIGPMSRAILDDQAGVRPAGGPSPVSETDLSTASEQTDQEQG
jgi:hypothetical protein